MSKKKWLPALLIIMIIADWLIIQFAPRMLNELSMEVTLSAEYTGDFQVYYAKDGIFSLEQAAIAKYNKAGELQTLKFDLGTEVYQDYRMDFGDAASEIVITDVKFVCGSQELHIPLTALTESTERHSILSIVQGENEIILNVGADDPRCRLQMGDLSLTNIENFVEEASASKTFFYHVLVCIAVDIVLIGFFIAGKHLKTLIRELVQNRRLILKLSVNDFKTKYVGSYLGIIWAFIQPVVTVIVYWFVFSVGLRVVPTGNVPFVLYLVSGIVPWYFFSDCLSGGTNALIEYQYLVKKIVFKISMLPMVKIISAMFVHLFFIAVALVIAILSGYLPGLYSLQIFYYIFCNFVLSLAIVFITCSVVVFFRDITQIITVILQVGIWALPIMYNFEVIPDRFQFVFRLNPMFYIVDGYRDAIVYGNWFFDKFYETVWFWFITVILFGIGTMIFKRLKVHFADVL